MEDLKSSEEDANSTKMAISMKNSEKDGDFKGKRKEIWRFEGGRRRREKGEMGDLKKDTQERNDEMRVELAAQTWGGVKWTNQENPNTFKEILLAIVTEFRSNRIKNN